MEATSNSTRGGEVCANIVADASALRMPMRHTYRITLPFR
jgi:hypothetical protein